MNGPELVRRIRPLRPNLAVLFMSGYNEAMVANQSQLDPDQYFLQKPIDIKTFVDKVRSILDASRIPDGVPGPAPGRA
jgi:FixJ family two-component response regulator